MIKNCDSCRHRDKKDYEVPCNTCSEHDDEEGFGLWEPIVNCHNCKYEDLESSKYPCKECFSYSKHVLTEDETKLGCNTCKQSIPDIKDCTTCRYECFMGYQEPCNTCAKFCNWSLLDSDNVQSPAHYTEYPKEVVDIIKFVLTEEQFKGWCIGNEIKYRLRAGLKDPDKMYEDLDKAMNIREWRK